MAVAIWFLSLILSFPLSFQYNQINNTTGKRDLGCSLSKDDLRQSLQKEVKFGEISEKIELIFSSDQKFVIPPIK